MWWPTMRLSMRNYARNLFLYSKGYQGDHVYIYFKWILLLTYSSITSNGYKLLFYSSWHPKFACKKELFRICCRCINCKVYFKVFAIRTRNHFFSNTFNNRYRYQKMCNGKLIGYLFKKSKVLKWINIIYRVKFNKIMVGIKIRIALIHF